MQSQVVPCAATDLECVLLLVLYLFSFYLGMGDGCFQSEEMVVDEWLWPVVASACTWRGRGSIWVLWLGVFSTAW